MMVFPDCAGLGTWASGTCVWARSRPAASREKLGTTFHLLFRIGAGPAGPGRGSARITDRVGQTVLNLRTDLAAAMSAFACCASFAAAPAHPANFPSLAAPAPRRRLADCALAVHLFGSVRRS